MAFSFGAAANTAQPSTNAFGTQPATTNTGGFGFGAAAQQPAQSGGTGLFGSTNTAGTTQPAAGGGLFGSTAAKPSLFVSTPSTTTAPAGGGLFGSTAQQPATGGGLFGSTAQQPAAGGLFGAKPATPAAGGGLFGSTAAAPAAGGGLFGAPKPAAPAGGLFGSTAQQQPSTGLFGSTATQQQPAGGLFGSTAQPQQQNMFGQSTAAPLGASTLAQSTLNAPKQEENIETRIMNIKNAWDVNSPDCRFKYFFYNVVDEGTTQFYSRPPGATDDAKWARAVRDNPDPTTMVPVLATGWGDVQKRVQAMNQTASVHQQRVKELNQALANLNRQTALSASVRLAALQAHLQQLTQRLLHLAAQSPSFAPTQSSAFRPEEGEMKHTLEAVKDSLDGRVRNHTSRSGGVGLAVAPRSQNKGRMLGQINELWGAVEEVRRQRRARGDTSWAGDERMLAEMAVVLEQQQTALTKLSELAQDAVFDADVIRQGLAAVDGRK